VATQKSKRKRRSPAQQPRGARAPRREHREQRRLAAESQRRAANRTLGTVGERPEGPFGGIPVSELAILAGAVAFVVGLVGGGGPPLYVGLVVVALGVVEFTAREHFSGYRSHTTLLAAMPTLGVATALELTVGSPSDRLALLALVVPVYAALFFALRRRFLAARQARLARPPAP